MGLLSGLSHWFERRRALARLSREDARELLQRNPTHRLLRCATPRCARAVFGRRAIVHALGAGRRRGRANKRQSDGPQGRGGDRRRRGAARGREVNTLRTRLLGCFCLRSATLSIRFSYPRFRVPVMFWRKRSAFCAMNPLSPNRMSAAERLDEIADILAAGLIRLRARKSSRLSRDRGESSLDFSPDQSGHVVVQELGGGRTMTRLGDSPAWRR